MTSLRIPFMDEIEEQIGVVVDHARVDELTKWIDWTETKRDKAAADSRNSTWPVAMQMQAGVRANVWRDVAHELRAARDAITDSLTDKAN